MAFNRGAGPNGSVAQVQPNMGKAASSTWQNLSNQRFPIKSPRRRRTLVVVSIILLVIIIFTTVRLVALLDASNDQITIHLGGQQTANVDLRQSLPISPDLLGVNIFPQANSNSLDANGTGFMNYTSLVTNDMRDMHIKLMRYPGGNWGEEHVLSFDQLGSFSSLLAQTNGDGMIQAHLSGPIGPNMGGTLTNDLASRTSLAAQWVDFMNNPNSTLRPKTIPFHPVKLWTVGNEPDLLINPQTHNRYTVAEYANAFIQFSEAMHKKDATIKVFGPEISQFYGVGDGPFDAGHHAWMDDFLKAIGDYEQQHPDLPFHILDGVSLHRYQFDNAQVAPSMVLSSTTEWDYTLPTLRVLLKQDLHRDAPIAVDEVNTNPGTNVPTQGVASLWWADTLGALMDQQAGYVGFFSASGVNTPYPLFSQDGLHETTMARVMQLFSHLQTNLVPLAVQHDPMSVYATQDNAHQTVSLLFINKSPSMQTAQIAPTNSFIATSLWPTLNVGIPAYSIAVITLHRSGTAEAYSFVEPTQNIATVNPLDYTACGQTSDLLAARVYC